MEFLKKHWWKGLCIALLLYAYPMGIYGKVPETRIHETIRNLYYHVPLWFSMTVMLFISLGGSIAYLRKGRLKHDFLAAEAGNMAIYLGVLGWLTGMIWGDYAWNSPLPKDPKLLGAGIGMLIYLAYFILRGSFVDEQQRARISAVYNILALPTFLALIYVMPRLTDSLHPGNGGNPGFNTYDRDRQMNLIFYSAIIGIILLSWWITSLRVRSRIIEAKQNDLI
jgi:heme exporter protein C